MRDAVKKSRDFDHELDALHALSKGDHYLESQIAVLDKTAKYGIPSMASLQKEFSTASEKILKQALLEKQDKSLLDKVTLKFSGIVHVRKITAEEDSQKSEDIIARSQSAIESGNAALAIKELDKLTESDRQVLNDWIQKAKGYVDSTDASDAILKYLTHQSTKNMAQANG